MAPFVLGEDNVKETRKCLRALLAHIHSEKGLNKREPIYLIINTKIALTRQKDYIPRIIPLSKGLEKLSDKSVLLITKDPSTHYRAELTLSGSLTEDVFNHIYSMKKLKALSSETRKIDKLFKEFDIVVADNRVHKFLPDLLGAKFYQKNKKVPFMLQMAKPDHNAVLTTGKKSHKLKDERCDPRYVYQQMKAIVKNTYYIPPANGNCISIKFGFTDWKVDELLENINDIFFYMIDSKYQPVGGLLRSVKNLNSAHIKTSESISLPIYKSGKDADISKVSSG
ncbi:uncharacterized protein PRCAT00004572001 [Priceomyces carsonii]|uniref:uncharacterized protein n=1 Tax=Priceomyces carsonii TaxID=28549 RepID=UPI002EDA3426|nr:unnamed protein product [Priceomyces carsonii]